MSPPTIKVSKQEVRIPIGDCPWCGKEQVSLRDYLCFHIKGVCCHEFLRAFQGKASLALRKFQGSRIETQEEWNEYVTAFEELVVNDERVMSRYGQLLEKVNDFQEEYGGEFSDLFAFLVRLYAARGHLKLVGTHAESALRQCLICAADLQEGVKSEICSRCQASVGNPEPAEEEAPSRPSDPAQAKRLGMATVTRRR